MSLESRLGAVKACALPSAHHLSVPQGSTVKAVLERMRDEKFDVVLITDGDRISGILTPEKIRQQILGRPDQWDKPVESLAEPVATLREGGLGELLKALQSAPWAVVQDAHIHVIRRAEMLRYLNGQLNTSVHNMPPEIERATRAREQVHS